MARKDWIAGLWLLSSVSLVAACGDDDGEGAGDGGGGLLDGSASGAGTSGGGGSPSRPDGSMPLAGSGAGDSGTDADVALHDAGMDADVTDPDPMDAGHDGGQQGTGHRDAGHDAGHDAGDVDIDAGSEDEDGGLGDEIEIAGEWLSNFGGTEVIDSFGFTTNGSTAAIIEYDNDDNAMITQNPSDDPWNPSAFNVIWWTEIEGDSFYYCWVDFGLATLDDARSSAMTADDSDPANGGCGGFSWTLLSAP